jgi:hypothetical protein
MVINKIKKTNGIMVVESEMVKNFTEKIETF